MKTSATICLLSKASTSSREPPCACAPASLLKPAIPRPAHRSASSYATAHPWQARGIATTGGVIDAGYRGEILVLMTNVGDASVELKAGEKIAQMIPVPVLTGDVIEVADLEESSRAAKGFGSSGR